MNDLFRIYFIVFFVFSAVLTGNINSFAQDDNVSSDKAAQAKTQQNLKDIHDLARKILETQKRLDALLESNDDQTSTFLKPALGTGNPSDQSAVPAPVQTPAQVQAVIPPPAPIAVQPAVSPQPPARIQPAAQIQAAPRAPLNPPQVHTFVISPEYFYSNYKQSGSYNTKGDFTGLALAYTYQPLDTDSWLINVFHADLHGDHGFSDYTYPGNGEINRVNDYMIEPRVWFGKNLFLGPNVTLTPYIGFGYRWYYEKLENDLSDDGAGNGGNNRQTQYIYVPVGGNLSVRPADGWQVDFNSEFDPLAWGGVNNYSAAYTLNSNNISTSSNRETLRHGYGVRGSIKIVKEYNAINYFIEPYIRYWNINSSKPGTTSELVNGAPVAVSTQVGKVTSTEAGARLGVEF